MTFYQTKFLIAFLIERACVLSLSTIRKVIYWVNDAAIALFDYMLHVSVYRYGIGHLNFDLDDSVDEADGVLWVRREGNGYIQTPLPFRIPNRWVIRCHPRMSHWLDMQIRSAALHQALMPSRINWKPGETEVQSWLTVAQHRAQQHLQALAELETL